MLVDAYLLYLAFVVILGVGQVQMKRWSVFAYSVRQLLIRLPCRLM
jgi:hypothetical protein